MQINEGYMPFGEYQTFYRVAGQTNGERKPLLLLHGGPGSTHNYFEVFDCLAEDGRAIVSYDQLGCGKSSVPDKPDLWTARTWLDELVALREHLKLDSVHLLGQSWGGMMAIQYMCDEAPKGVASIILASTLPSSSLWEQEGRRNIRLMPPEQQEALLRAEQTGDYDDPAYTKAIDSYLERHCYDLRSAKPPECFTRKKVFGKQSYECAWGPNEYKPTGTLKEFEYLDKLHTINVPTLITSGIGDESTPLLNKMMQDRIPGAKWELFAHSQHMSFLQEGEKYMRILADWLRKTD